MELSANTKIAVIGLGYVGLPLAVSLAKHFTVTGFDINQSRVEHLRDAIDPTNEVSSQALKNSHLECSYDKSCLENQDIYIITVPTPVTNSNTPDLSLLESAAESIGQYLLPGNIVILESTVYPGVTEEFLGPILERHSQLKSGSDFFLAYSPERMNPGDKKHHVESITKVVSGQTEAITELLSELYGKLNDNNIFKATSIKVAEAAKVIENTQRDINIAFINEIMMLLNKMELSVYDVLEAAKTKWNFLNFTPGLVGGHCIGVDPYYLAHAAHKVNHEPIMTLSGRHTNESVAQYLAYHIDDLLMQNLPEYSSGKILILGLTFKEDVSDLRNTKVVDLIKHLKKLKHQVDVHDPVACHAEAEAMYGLPLLSSLEDISQYDCVIGCVPHQVYQKLSDAKLQSFIKPSGHIVDLKNMWNDKSLNIIKL